MASRSALLFPFLMIAGVAAACTTNVIEHHVAPPGDDGGLDGTAIVPDGGPGEDAAVRPFVFTPAPEGTFAQAVSAGGAVVKAPKVVPIVFTNDPQKQAIIDFTTKLAASTYWGQISAEYGVGALTPKTPIILTETPPTKIDDDQIGAWLTAKFTSDPTRFGVPDASTLYAIYYPTGTTVTHGGNNGGASVSCSDFGGYHYETVAGTTKVAYAVMPRCAAFAGLGGVDVTTFTASHEILEWATDPFPVSATAYYDVDADHAVWSRIFTGELADLCVQGDTSVVPTDLAMTVQRSWSNLSAKAGHNPCVPVAQSPYFTAFPTKPETISVMSWRGRMSTRGFKVAVGESKTVDLTMYSDAAVGKWAVQVVDLSKLERGPDEFSYALDKSQGTSGETLHLTITGERPATNGQGFMLVSRIKNELNYWPVWVVN